MSASIAIPGDLMMKLGSGVLEIFESKSEVEIDFTIDELILIREIAHSQAKYGAEFVGLSLKKKIYEALIALMNQESAEDLLSGLNLSGSPDNAQSPN